MKNQNDFPIKKMEIVTIEKLEAKDSLLRHALLAAKSILASLDDYDSIADVTSVRIDDEFYRASRDYGTIKVFVELRHDYTVNPYVEDSRSLYEREADTPVCVGADAVRFWSEATTIGCTLTRAAV